MQTRGRSAKERSLFRAELRYLQTRTDRRLMLPRKKQTMRRRYVVLPTSSCLGMLGRETRDVVPEEMDSAVSP